MGSIALALQAGEVPPAGKSTPLLKGTLNSRQLTASIKQSYLLKSHSYSNPSLRRHRYSTSIAELRLGKSHPLESGILLLLKDTLTLPQLTAANIPSWIKYRLAKSEIRYLKKKLVH